MIGGRPYTSVEAIARFAEQRGDHATPAVRTPARRERDIRQAEEELERDGI